MAAPAPAPAPSSCSFSSPSMPAHLADCMERLSFCDGSGPYTVASAGSAAAPPPSSAQPPPPPPPPPPPRPFLHRHALECVLCFCDLRGLAWASRVGRPWRAAAVSMRGAAAVAFALPPPPPAASPVLLRHVTVIGSSQRCLLLDASALALLGRVLPELQQLYCALDVPTAALTASASALPSLFPASLRRLHVEMLDHCSAAGLNAVLVAAGRLPQLESLHFFPARMDHDLDFRPLAALPRLHGLDLRWRSNTRCSCCFGGRLQSAQIDQLGALPALRLLRLTLLDKSQLGQLARSTGPLRLQLRDLTLPDPFTDECADLLSLLPSLTVLRLDRALRLSRLDFLRALPALTLLDLSLEHCGLSGACVAAAVQSCVHLTSLDLAGARIDADETAAMLRPLHALRDLRLRFLDGVASLECIDTPRLRASLRSLRLAYCQHPELSPSECLRLLRFTRLTSLSLCHSFSGPLDAAALALFTPPSTALPYLDHFEYQPRQAEEEDDASTPPPQLPSAAAADQSKEAGSAVV